MLALGGKVGDWFHLTKGDTQIRFKVVRTRGSNFRIIFDAPIHVNIRRENVAPTRQQGREAVHSD